MILIVTALSLAVILATFIGALSVAQANRKGSIDDFSQTQYSSFPATSSKPQSNNSSQVSSEIDSSNSSSETSSEEPAEMLIEAGTYANNDNLIIINSAENGFIDAKAVCGGITMEFSGQAVENTLVATGTDSLNNTVEVTLTFTENTITAESKPLIMYEDTVECIEISGTFVK